MGTTSKGGQQSETWSWRGMKITSVPLQGLGRGGVGGQARPGEDLR